MNLEIYNEIVDFIKNVKDENEKNTLVELLVFKLSEKEVEEMKRIILDNSWKDCIEFD